MPQAVLFLSVCFLGAALYVIKLLFDSSFSPPLPPGPAGLPVIGNYFQLTSKKTWEDFTALGKKYGDISSIRILGTRFVILNSQKAVDDILEKHGQKSSDRPRLIMAEMVGLNNAMAFQQYTDRLRIQRKHFARLFGTKISTSVFNPIEEEETRRFLRSVLKEPEDLIGHLRYTAGAIILKVSYGYPAQEKNDPMIELAEKLTHVIAEVADPGKFLVDSIPALKHLPEWVPGTGFLQDAKKYREYLAEAVRMPHKYVKEQMAAGKAIPSFLSTLLEIGLSPEEEELIVWTSWQIYMAGSDTIAAAVYAFFLAMVLYPDVQAKAKAEIDSVVGTGRLPSFNDRDSLPYVNALCKEVHRWHTVAPLAMPHVATEDIHSNGFLIPKGAHIVGNAWGILHDEAIYPDPDIFRPERYLGETPQPDPHMACFGFGRRICTGIHFAEAAVFISVAMSLAVLDISKAKVDGIEVIPKYEVNPGAISHAMPFKCQISPRSAQTEAWLYNS